MGASPLPLHDYRAALDKAGLIAYMSRKGNCSDSAPMESFFHTNKTVELHHHTFKTKDKAKSVVFKYIEVYYNRHRIHSAIGYLTPEQMKLKIA
jgi:putative transposase